MTLIDGHLFPEINTNNWMINELSYKLELASKSLDYITHMHVITPHEKGTIETCAGCVAMRALKELENYGK